MKKNHQKNLLNMFSSSSHPRLGWVCFFIRFGEMQHSITVSAMDPLQWMGAIRMRLFHWMKHYYRLIFYEFEVENVLMDLFLRNTQLLSSPDVNWWTGVVWITFGLLCCFYQLFGLSFWRHPFTAEHPLLSKWWNATLKLLRLLLSHKPMQWHVFLRRDFDHL